MDGSGVNNPMIRVSNRSFQVMVSRKTILRAEGVVSYAFQGGEPTLRGIDFFKKAVAYEKHYNRNHIKVQNAFQTNGYLLDDEWCAFLRKTTF